MKFLPHGHAQGVKQSVCPSVVVVVIGMKTARVVVAINPPKMAKNCFILVWNPTISATRLKMLGLVLVMPFNCTPMCFLLMYHNII